MIVKVIAEGPQGPPGPAIASGGTTGQVLAKASNDDYDTEWLTVGGTGTVTSVGIVPASGMVVSGSPVTAAGNITLSYDSGFQAYTTAEANKLASIASGAQVNEATNLSYTASSRLLDSSTGSGTTLPLFSSTEPGLVGGSGGGTVNFLRADGTWAEPAGGGGGSGTVTSVALSVPSGFAVAGSPITTSGTIALSFDAGYSLPTNTKQGQWDTAYSERLYWNGGATGLNAITARASLELGNAATLNVGTTAGTVLAGDALSVHTAAADPHPNYALESSLATVATTGAYSDLTGKPSIPSAADALPQNLGVAAIGVSTDYAREDHTHAMPSAGDVGADPAGTAASGISAHVAASDPHPGYALESNLATVATTGSYADLSNTPTFTGPIVAGRASGTGALESLTLGAGLSIVGSQLTVSSSGTGTVTSVGLVAPSGFVVSGSPITGAGNITLSFASGYSLPTTASQANWDTAYSERLYWDGGPTGLNAASGRTSLGLAAVASTGAYGDLTGTPVIPSGADATPQPLGVAAVGISTDYAREDHIHAMPSAADVGADPAGTSASGISAHEAAADPHPNYALESSLGGAALLNVGTTSGTVAAGNDSRFTTDLSYTATTRVLASSTGADVTLPLFSSTEAGLTPQSGGGTTNFLRADGTWAAPAGGGGGTVISPGYQTFANGSLIAPPCCRNGTGNSNSVATGRAFFWQLYIPAAQTFTQILCRTQSNYAGTSDIVLGIYDHNSSINRPNAKIYDSGTFQITASGAANYGPGPISVTLQPGFYWLAFLSISAATTPSFAAPNVASNGALGYPWYAEVTTGGAAVFTLLANGLSSLPATAPTLAVNSSAAGALVFLGV